MATNVGINAILASIVSALQPMSAVTGQATSPTRPLFFAKSYFGRPNIAELQARGEVGRTPCAFVVFDDERTIRTTIGRRVDLRELSFSVIVCSDSMRSRDDRSTVIPLDEQIRNVVGARRFGLQIKPMRWRNTKLIFDDGKLAAHAVTFSTRAHVDYTKQATYPTLSGVYGLVGKTRTTDYATALLASRVPRNYWTLDNAGGGLADRGSGGVTLVSSGGAFADCPSIVAGSLTGAVIAGETGFPVYSATPGSIVGNFDIEAWLYPIDFDLMSQGQIGWFGFSFGFDSSGHLAIMRNGVQSFSSPLVYAGHVPRYVVAKHAPGLWKLYVDGAFVTSVASSPVDSTGQFSISGADGGHTAFQHVAITPGGLTDAQIAATAKLGAELGGMHVVFP